MLRVGNTKLATHSVRGKKVCRHSVVLIVSACRQDSTSYTHLVISPPNAAKQVSKDASNSAMLRSQCSSTIATSAACKEFIHQHHYYVHVCEYVNGDQMLHHIISHGRLQERMEWLPPAALYARHFPRETRASVTQINFPTCSCLRTRQSLASRGLVTFTVAAPAKSASTLKVYPLSKSVARPPIISHYRGLTGRNMRGENRNKGDTRWKEQGEREVRSKGIRGGSEEA